MFISIVIIISNFFCTYYTKNAGALQMFTDKMIKTRKS